jgi:hypothetical protein
VDSDFLLHPCCGSASLSWNPDQAFHIDSDPDLSFPCYEVNGFGVYLWGLSSFLKRLGFFKVLRMILNMYV